jgi:putative hydrolase of the HAD superfamily
MTLPENLTTILFDVGNTLRHLDYEFLAGIITAHGTSASARQVAEAEYAAKAALDEHLRRARQGSDESRRAPYFEVIMAHLGIPAESHERIGAAFRAENQRSSLWRVMHPATPDVLTELRRRGLRLGVVSNADGRVPAGLAECGLAEHFVAIVDSHLVGVEKPDPRIFGIALEQCGSKAADAVYVGDIYEIDVRGARAAGLTPILLDPLDAYGEVDCLRIDSLTRLLDLLPASR